MLSSLISMLIIFVLAMSKLDKSKAMNSKSLIAWFVHTHHKCVIEKVCRRGRGGFKREMRKVSGASGSSELGYNTYVMSTVKKCGLS